MEPIIPLAPDLNQTDLTKWIGNVLMQKSHKEEAATLFCCI